MKDFKIALIQQQSFVGRKADNLRRTLSWIEKASSEGADLICFPELNITGHAGAPEMIMEAESVPDGNSVKTLCSSARDYNVYICAGIAESDRGVFYNTQFLVGPDGYIGKQRKTHLSHDEYYYFRAGSKLSVFSLPFVKMGLIICYDNLMPEVARVMAVQGAELLFCPHAARFGALPDTREEREQVVSDHKKDWQGVHTCRALDNGCYVALCNAVGSAVTEGMDVEANHAGACMIFDPNGDLLTESQSKDIEEEMLVVQLPAKLLDERHRNTCFNLSTRRPEVFRALIEPTE